MRNWSVDTSNFDKKKVEYSKWKYEQLINFGLHGEKLNRNDLERFFSYLDLDPSKRAFIQFLMKYA